jgi:hypothetical protein
MWEMKKRRRLFAMLYSIRLTWHLRNDIAPRGTLEANPD